MVHPLKFDCEVTLSKVTVRTPKGKGDRLPAIIFQGQAVKLQGCKHVQLFWGWKFARRKTDDICSPGDLWNKTPSCRNTVQ